MKAKLMLFSLQLHFKFFFDAMKVYRKYIVLAYKVLINLLGRQSFHTGRRKKT